jgi:hypothetical protein
MPSDDKKSATIKTMEAIACEQMVTFYRWANALALITIFYNLIEGKLQEDPGQAHPSFK